MDELDRKLLERLQDGLPLASRPFALIAQEVGTGEAEALARVGKLAADGLLRRIGPIIDPQKAGRVGTLAAMAVPAERVEEVAALVSAREGVSHNYLREARHGRCPYNLWFTLSAESGEALAAALAELERAAGLPVLALPTRRMFKIGVRFNLGESPDDG